MSTDLTPRGDDRGAPDDPDRIPPNSGELATFDDGPRFPIPDPGLEEHLPRLSDVDEKAGDRQARIVATFFGMVPILAIIFVVIYFAVPKEMYIDFGPLRSNAQNVGFGLTLGLALLFIGMGAVQWARQLMYDGEMVDHRHPVASQRGGPGRRSSRRSTRASPSRASPAARCWAAACSARWA